MPSDPKPSPPRTAVIAVAALVRDGRVLMAHRTPGRAAYPDCWDLVGGHVEDRETPEQAVIRECAEELAVRLLDPRPFPMVATGPGIDKYAFVVRHWWGQPVNAAPDEHDELRWFLPGELTQLQLADPAGLADIVNATAT